MAGISSDNEADSQAVVTNNSNEAKPEKECKGSESCLKQLMTSRWVGALQRLMRYC